jgi:hypothetical protein
LEASPHRRQSPPFDEPLHQGSSLPFRCSGTSLTLVGSCRNSWSCSQPSPPAVVAAPPRRPPVSRLLRRRGLLVSCGLEYLVGPVRRVILRPSMKSSSSLSQRRLAASRACELAAPSCARPCAGRVPTCRPSDSWARWPGRARPVCRCRPGHQAEFGPMHGIEF